MSLEFTVDNEMAQKRLDLFLTEKTGFLRSKVQKLIKQNKVKVNNLINTKSSYRLKNNDFIFIKDSLIEQKTIFPAYQDLDIIFEDEEIIAINKPAGLVSHPGNNIFENTLLNYLHGYLKKEVFLAHRLDKDTSGVILATKSQESLANLQKQWQEHSVKKIYQTLVIGHLPSKTGLIDSPITRSKRTRTEMDVSILKKAKDAKSYFEVLNKFQETSLLKVQIFTGRTHQIRVHFKAIKHPVVGDKTYGNSQFNKIFEEKFELKRQFLHAHLLNLKHPKTKKTINLKAKLPKELETVLKILKKGNI